MWALTAARSAGVSRWALRSSLATAKLAFLCNSLQLKGLAMQMAPASKAGMMGWFSPYFSSSSVVNTRL